MTKPRAPLSVEQALARIAGLIGYDSMSTVTGRCPGHIRAWGDPDRDDQIPLDKAIALDCAYISAGGDDAPLYAAYTHKLELAALERFACGIQLARHAADVIRECGEAGAALVLAAQPGACDKTRANAEREVTEALEKLKRALPMLSPQEEAQPP